MTYAQLLPERRRRADAKLSDEQLRLLHRAHVERDVSIRELGRMVWRQTGFTSASAAGRAIARGFVRLHLPSRSPTESRDLAKLRGYARCQGVKTNGEQCESFALRGDHLCWPHRFPELARQQAIASSPFVRAAA
jgi:hypothetical protein